VLQENNVTSGIKVVVGDGDWGPAVDVLRDPKFAEAVDIIGLVQVVLLSAVRVKMRIHVFLYYCKGSGE
jgi:hypothetical protein